MGNKPVPKVDNKVSIVMEQMIRLLHDCGLPAEGVGSINSMVSQWTSCCWSYCWRFDFHLMISTRVFSILDFINDVDVTLCWCLPSATLLFYASYASAEAIFNFLCDNWGFCLFTVIDYFKFQLIIHSYLLIYLQI